MKERFAVSTEDFSTIQAKIITRFAGALQPIDQPVVVILGGQPGCGKTELEKIASDELGGNVMVCNGDIFRDYHPQAETIKADFEAYYLELTVKTAHAWNQGLREYCEQRRLNYILETTF